MMRAKISTMGMINTIKLLLLDSYWYLHLNIIDRIDSKYTRHTIVRPQYHCCKLEGWQTQHSHSTLINSTRGSSHTNHGVHSIRHSHPYSTHLLLIKTPCWQTLQQRYYSSIHPQTPYQLKCELASQMNYEFWMILTDCQYRAVSYKSIQYCP